VQRLKRYKSQAKAPEKVYPVEWETVSKIKDRVAAQVWSMILIQWHSGMRPGEVVQIRPCDIDMSGDVWFYRPQEHKTKHRGHERVIGLGKTCQSILQPWLDRPPSSYCFSPAEAEETRRSNMTRKTKVQPSQICRKKENPKKKPGDRYTQQSYAKAIALGCRKAGIERWGPNRIRHSFATRVRQQFGLDAAQVALGHKHAKITEVYAERTTGDIEKIAKELG
jgi:integrase